MNAYPCSCGHGIARQPSMADGCVLWFHPNAARCACRIKLGCGGPPGPAALVGAIVNGLQPPHGPRGAKADEPSHDDR